MKSKKNHNLESFKIDKSVLKLVRDNKKETGVSCKVFIEKAIKDRLTKSSNIENK